MTQVEAEEEAQRRWGPKAFAFSYGVLFEVHGPNHFGIGKDYESAFSDAEPYSGVNSATNAERRQNPVPPES